MEISRDAIFMKIKKILCEVLGTEEGEIKRESRIVHDLGAESLDLITLMMELEDEFKHPIPDDEAVNLVTVADVENYIFQKHQELSLKV